MLSYQIEGETCIAFLLEVVWEDLSPCFFQLLETACISWLMAKFSIFQSFSDSDSLSSSYGKIW